MFRSVVFVALAGLCIAATGCDHSGSGGGTGSSGSSGSPLAIQTGSLSNGVVAANYSQVVTASGGSGAGYTWSIVSGSLPPGLSLTGGTPSATIDGAPTTAGTFDFTLEVQDSAGGLANQAFTVAVIPALLITTSVLPDGVAGQAYSQQVSATGGSGAGFVWSVVSGSLPPGLSLTGSTPSATISGTPTVVGAYPFTVEVQDSMGNTDTQSLTVSVFAASSLTILTTALPNGRVGASYTGVIFAEGGSGVGYQWSVAASSSLPAGLSLSGSTPMAVIDGDPQVSGQFSFDLELTDSLLNFAIASVTIYIEPAPVAGPLTIVTTSLPNAGEGVLYEEELVATGGSATLNWSVAAGSTLPAGLTITKYYDRTSLEGTPTVQGFHAFTLEVTDWATTLSQPFSMTVQPMAGALQITTAALADGFLGAAYQQTISATGGSGSGYSWSFTPSANLPGGMALQSGTPDAVLSGTPGQIGLFKVHVRVVDSNNNAAAAWLDLAVNRGAGPAVAFGHTIPQKSVFLCDTSGSMYGSRIAALRAELTEAVNSMPAGHEFDLVAFDDTIAFMWGGLQPASAANKSAAVAWIAGPNMDPGGATAMYPVLQQSCALYPTDLEAMFLISDGLPSVGGSATQVLAVFPTWWAPFTQCTLVCVSMAANSYANDFLTQLALLAGQQSAGVYTSWE